MKPLCPLGMTRTPKAMQLAVVSDVGFRLAQHQSSSREALREHNMVLSAEMARENQDCGNKKQLKKSTAVRLLIRRSWVRVPSLTNKISNLCLHWFYCVLDVLAKHRLAQKGRGHGLSASQPFRVRTRCRDKMVIERARARREIPLPRCLDHRLRPRLFRSNRAARSSCAKTGARISPIFG
jgi:hypothetical protein